MSFRKPEDVLPGNGGVLSIKIRGGELSREWLAALFILPAVAFTLAILAYPLLSAFVLAFHRVTAESLIEGGGAFVGLRNFAFVLSDPTFLTSARNTAMFVGFSVFLEVVLGLGIALVINDRSVWLSRVTRALILVPWAIPPIVNGLLWSFIYNSKYGYLNALLYQTGMVKDFVQWVGDPRLALFAVVVAYVWRTTPFGVILLYAALQGIPEEVHEAAEVDGATLWQRFWSVTLPLLRPVLVVLLVLRTTFAFMVFDEILAITQGGPGNATWTLAWYTYSHAFRYLDFGVGAASGFVLALLVGATAVLYTRYVSLRVEY